MFCKKKLLVVFTTLLIVGFSTLDAMNQRELFLVAHVTKSIEMAQKNISKLPSEVFSIYGMSGVMGRHLLNNLCSMAGVNYLEIGIHQGSTFIAALNQNKPINAIAIDNWSEFGNARNVFLDHAKRFIPEVSFQFYDDECFRINKDLIFKNKINIYFYDADHSVEAQKKAFTYFNDILDDTFIAIVDDYNWESVQQGTMAAFKLLNYRIVFERYLTNNFYPDREGWWNGLYIAVISKQ